MSVSMWVRPLTLEELNYFYKTELGNHKISAGPLSIMGKDDHYSLINLNIKVEYYRTYIQDGFYLEDALGITKAEGGKKVPIKWSSEAHIGYLLREAKSLNLTIFEHPNDSNLIYLQTSYSDACLEVFNFVNNYLFDWYHDKPFLKRFFGAMTPDFDSSETREISKEVRKILIRASQTKNKGVFN